MTVERVGAVVKTKTYVNRQPGYKDPFEIEYRRYGRDFLMYANLFPGGKYPNRYEESHLRDEDQWICVAPGKEPKSFEAAEAIAHYWMLGFSEFVRTGVFPKKTLKFSVPD